ncbi:MAG: hypothetical protein JOZ38_03820 [Candidatus Eremiobacteraeota bacterium]|nr:hypothetical protein [Candidatus Eremiobacteraeota bacterium]
MDSGSAPMVRALVDAQILHEIFKPLVDGLGPYGDVVADEFARTLARRLEDADG